MKAFRFNLTRPLEWRSTCLSLEEAGLERLQSALQELHRALVELATTRHSCVVAVQQTTNLQGSQLRSMESHLQWLERQEKALRTRMQQAAGAVAKQQEVVVQARRAVRLLERLKETRFAEWKREEAREMDNLAGEYAIAQWRRNHPCRPSGDDMRTTGSR